MDACPIHAMYLEPSVYPAPQQKNEEVRKSLFALAKCKATQERLAIATCYRDATG
ncbi:MAG: hypothetical protein AB7D04_08060 [Sphaerochaeta sp.]